MPRALNPATPSGELAARQSWRGATVTDQVLTPELAAFCQSGLSIVVASVAVSRQPVVAEALACRIDDTGTIRLILGRDACGNLLDAIASGAGIAATISRPRDHRSIQIKGSAAQVEPLADGDVEAAREYGRAFAEELVAVGYPPAFAATHVAFDSDDLVAVEFAPTAAFVQTPGPGAGAALTA